MPNVGVVADLSTSDRIRFVMGTALAVPYQPALMAALAAEVMFRAVELKVRALR